MASVQKRPDGKYRARYRDESGREHARHFDRRTDAARWLAEVTAAQVTGTYCDPKAGRVTFADFYASWAPRQVWVPGTVKAMDLAARDASASFGSVPLSRLRRSHVEGWVKAMDTRGLAPGTVKTRVNNVRAVLRAAVRDRVIPSDPSEGVTLPRARRREAAMELPTVDQVAALIAAAEPRFRAFLSLAAFAGMRLGEVAALQVGDIDFLRRQIVVSRQVQRAGGGRVEIRAPKYGSERVVYAGDTLLRILAAHVADHCPGDAPSRWLFAGIGQRGDQPPHQNTVTHVWGKARRSARVEGLTLHDLRHYYASGLIAAGCDVVTVQRALGHRSATITLSTYAHLWPTAEDRTRRAAEDLAAAAVEKGLADCVRTATAP